MPGDTLPPLPELRSLVLTPGYMIAQPKTDTHRLMLWNGVEYYPEPTVESGIVLTAMKNLLEIEPISSKRRTIAECAISDLIADKLFVEPTTPETSSSARSRLLVLSTLGLQAASDSVRPFLIDPAQHHFYTRRRAYQVYRKASRALH